MCDVCCCCPHKATFEDLKASHCLGSLQWGNRPVYWIIVAAIPKPFCTDMHCVVSCLWLVGHLVKKLHRIHMYAMDTHIFLNRSEYESAHRTMCRAEALLKAKLPHTCVFPANPVTQCRWLHWLQKKISNSCQKPSASFQAWNCAVIKSAANIVWVWLLKANAEKSQVTMENNNLPQVILKQVLWNVASFRSSFEL